MVRSRFEEIASSVGQRITGGAISAGDTLTLAEIEAEFSCSRTVAREVQRSLEECGLIVAQRRRGLIVQPKENWDVFNPRVIRWRLDGPQSDLQIRSLIDLRLAIEPVAANLAAQFASRGQRDEIVRVANELVSLGQTSSGAEFMAADIRFHALVLEATGNEMFSALTPAIEAVLRWRTDESLMPPHPEPRAMHDHATTARAIYSGDGKLAEESMRDIVTEVRIAFETNAPNILRFD